MAEWLDVLKPTPQRILSAMLGGARTLSEISAKTKLKKPALVPHLKDLVALGVLRHERVPTSTGTEARYEPNAFSLHLSLDPARGHALAWGAPGAWDPRFPLAAQVAQPDVRAQIVAFLAALRATPIGDELVVILYGSGARGDATWKSDIDLIVLASPARPRGETQRAVETATFESSIGAQHAIRPSIETREDFELARKRVHVEAMAEGLVVWAGGDAPWSKMERYRSISL